MLDELSHAVSPAAHTVVRMNRAGWHIAKTLAISANLIQLFLPPYSPELNAIERVWLYPRERFLSHRLWPTYDDILEVCCAAWSALLAETSRIHSLCALASAPGWVPAAMQSHRLELSLRIRSFAPDQRGAARIFTLSAAPFRRNITIGQDGEDLILRLRTAATDLNGTLADGAPPARVPGVFRTAAAIDLRIDIAPGLRLEVGDEFRVNKDLTAEPLRHWNPITNRRWATS